MPRLNRRKSIRTPQRRDKIAPHKRMPTGDDGPTDVGSNAAKRS